MRWGFNVGAGSSLAGTCSTCSGAVPVVVVGSETGAGAMNGVRLPAGSM